MVREGVDWQGIQNFLEHLESRNRTAENVESATSKGGPATQEQSGRMPMAFDEWIAEVFGSPEASGDLPDLG